jgi:hypothetical protein
MLLSGQVAQAALIQETLAKPTESRHRLIPHQYLAVATALQMRPAVMLTRAVQAAVQVLAVQQLDQEMQAVTLQSKDLQAALVQVVMVAQAAVAQPQQVRQKIARTMAAQAVSVHPFITL